MQADPKTLSRRDSHGSPVVIHWTRHTPRGVCPPLDDALDKFHLAAAHDCRAVVLVDAAMRICPARLHSGISRFSIAERVNDDERCLQAFAAFYAKWHEVTSRGCALAPGIVAEYAVKFDALPGRLTMSEIELLCEECSDIQLALEQA